VSALVLKSTFAIRELGASAKRCITADLERKRSAVSAIVSRDTSRLTAAELNSGAVESVAENLTDSIISPLLYYALFGVAGAMAFRAVNTADAMWGYRSKRYIELGSFAARTDDMLNFIPARLSGLLICVLGGNPRRAIRTVKTYRTVKLNPGWTLSAMSGSLGVTLSKPGCYRIGSYSAQINDAHIIRAVGIMRSCALVAVLICVLLMLILYQGGWRWFA
jgi:adenosylcobinamide-phosphate synthase